MHFGPVLPGYVVVNKNGIPVDCRSENLQLIRADELKAYEFPEQREETVYWSIIRQVVVNPLDEMMVRAHLVVVKIYPSVLLL